MMAFDHCVVLIGMEFEPEEQFAASEAFAGRSIEPEVPHYSREVPELNYLKNRTRRGKIHLC